MAGHPQQLSGRPASASPVGLRRGAGAAVQPGPERQAWHDDVRAPFTTTVVGAPLGPESRIWYRAVQTHFLPTALSTRHTRTISSRFSGATPASPGYEILYLAENHAVALLEAQALLGSPTTPGGMVPHPHSTWTILNVSVRLQAVAELSDA